MRDRSVSPSNLYMRIFQNMRIFQSLGGWLQLCNHPILEKSHAALPGLIVWAPAWPLLILICFGFDSSLLGIVMWSTPCLNSALIFSGVTAAGKVKERLNR